MFRQITSIGYISPKEGTILWLAGLEPSPTGKNNIQLYTKTQVSEWLLCMAGKKEKKSQN